VCETRLLDARSILLLSIFFQISSNIMYRRTLVWLCCVDSCSNCHIEMTWEQSQLGMKLSLQVIETNTIIDTTVHCYNPHMLMSSKFHPHSIHWLVSYSFPWTKYQYNLMKFSFYFFYKKYSKEMRKKTYESDMKKMRNTDLFLICSNIFF
jgi:hypothetical protein